MDGLPSSAYQNSLPGSGFAGTHATRVGCASVQTREWWLLEWKLQEITLFSSKSTFWQCVVIRTRRKASYQSVLVVNSLSGADLVSISPRCGLLGSINSTISD